MIESKVVFIEVADARGAPTPKGIQKNIDALQRLLPECCRKSRPTRGRPCCADHCLVWDTISILVGIQKQL